jgi:hypothetical protein
VGSVVAGGVVVVGGGVAGSLTVAVATPSV